MIHPVVVNPVLNPVVRVTDPVRWRAGRNAPLGSILHWDADLDAFSEQVGGPHTFNHAVLSPQYQRSADGSYANVGAKPAVDVFGGKKWLRSCGAVTNLLPSGAEDLTSTSWIKRGTAVVAAGNLVSGIATGLNDVYIVKSGLSAGVSIGPSIEIKRVSTSGVLAIRNPSDGTNAGRWDVNLALLSDDYELITSSHPAVTIATNFVVASGGGCGFHFTYLSGPSPLSFYARNPQLTATSYPVPYVPPGVTQPASNATVTSGSWFSLPDGSPLWQALTGEPLTLATRVRMGVGSGDMAYDEKRSSLSSSEISWHLQYFGNFAGSIRSCASYDGTTLARTDGSWPRNSIIRRVTQVNTAGTQFRVGYMIEGTHTTIQWTNWANFDGSFNPSTLYRLMLGFNNAYPMWFNKITAWKKQVTDAEILEAMA